MLKVNEIYQSIQGESSFSGLPCVFVRLTGCHLRCSWCDTAYAFYEGQDMAVDDVIKEVESHAIKLVELTGGEPLLQEDAFHLVSALLDRGFQVLIETSGAVDLSKIDSRAVKIMDIKCPGSGMHEKMLWENLQCLNDRDEIKFVIRDREDFDWACHVIEERNLSRKEILFSPVFGEVLPRELSEWILEKKCRVRLQLQLHKYIWSPDTRGV